MKCMKRIGICLCVLMLLVASLSVALAEAGDIFLRRDGQNDPSIIRYRQRMVDYGFYGSFVPDSNAMLANDLSDADIAALQKLTEMNPEVISDPSQGVTYDVFWNVVDYEGRYLQKPSDIPLGTTNAGEIFLRINGENDPSIIRYRQCMVDYGFYGSFVPDSNAMLANDLSDADIAALQKLTEMNPDVISDPSQGVTYDVYWNVVDYEGRDLKTPNDIVLTTTSEVVTKG